MFEIFHQTAQSHYSLHFLHCRPPHQCFTHSQQGCNLSPDARRLERLVQTAWWDSHARTTSGTSCGNVLKDLFQNRRFPWTSHILKSAPPLLVPPPESTPPRQLPVTDTTLVSGPAPPETQHVLSFEVRACSWLTALACGSPFCIERSPYGWHSTQTSEET